MSGRRCISEIAFATVVLSLILHCGKPPTFSQQGYFFIGKSDEAMAQRENPEILRAVEGVITAIVEKKPEALLTYVHPGEGAIIDAKAFVSYAQVASALHEPQSQLYRVLWDDKYWKETAPSDNIRSYRKTFLSAGEIRLGLFYYSDSECEVRLDFKDRPPMGIMANLILRKRNGRWYLMNFF